MRFFTVGKRQKQQMICFFILQCTLKIFLYIAQEEVVFLRKRI